MKPGAVSMLFFALSATSLPADDLQSLIEDYEVVKTKALGVKNAKKHAREVQPILNRIGALKTDEAMRFLLDEIGVRRAPFAEECARAILTSGHERAVAMLFEGFSKRPPRSCTAILDAIQKIDRQAANQKPAPQARRKRAKPRKPAKKLEPVDLTPAEAIIVAEARKVKHPRVRHRLVLVMAKLRSVSAASALLSLLSGAAGAQADELQAAAVDALVSMGVDEAVREWLAGDAFAEAGADEARLALVAEVTGRLELESARKRLESLLGQRSRQVAVAAFEALTRLGKDLPSKAVRLVSSWLLEDLAVGLRVKLLDGMARDGSRSALAVVLKAARSRDSALRAIALGSLALAIADSKALERVLLGLKDPVRDVRSAALRAVVGVRVNDVITALVEYLGRERESRLQVDALRLLISMTGHNMGLIAGDWKKWWRHEKSSFEFPKQGAAEVTSVRAHDLSYFGIEVSSKRIAFLIDVSLSMLPVTRTSKKKGGSLRKLDLMKRELIGVLRKLAPEARVNIFAFDRAVRSWEKKLRPLSARARSDAIEYVKDIGTGGGTNIFDSIELSLADSEVDTIYLLTDGMPTTGRYSTPEGIVRGTREINRARAVTIHCIAFGADSDLLKQLAADHGGQYRFVDE